MIITKEWLNKHKTANGAWTKRQLAALYLGWPMSKGWQSRLIGTKITTQQRLRFEKAATSTGSKDKTKELQQQIIGLNKKIVELQAGIEARNKELMRQVQESEQLHNDLYTYLLNHEVDIASGVNDFGCLEDVFITWLERKPRKE